MSKNNSRELILMLSKMLPESFILDKIGDELEEYKRNRSKDQMERLTSAIMLFLMKTIDKPVEDLLEEVNNFEANLELDKVVKAMKDSNRN